MPTGAASKPAAARSTSAGSRDRAESAGDCCGRCSCQPATMSSNGSCSWCCQPSVASRTLASVSRLQMSLISGVERARSAAATRAYRLLTVPIRFTTWFCTSTMMNSPLSLGSRRIRSTTRQVSSTSPPLAGSARRLSPRSFEERGHTLLLRCRCGPAQDGRITWRLFHSPVSLA
jgi:hypothetical protein